MNKRFSKKASLNNIQYINGKSYTTDCGREVTTAQYTAFDENAAAKLADEYIAVMEKDFADALTSARYTSSRIRRIALQNLLKIDETLIRNALCAPLYLRVLAANKGSTEILSALNESTLPVIARAHDEDELTGIAKQAYDIDCFAENAHRLLYSPLNKRTIFV